MRVRGIRSGSTWVLVGALFASLSASADDVVVELGSGDGLAVKDHTAVERFRVDGLGNLSFDTTLTFHRTGTDNTFLGADAGATGASGQRNVAVGSEALGVLSAGSENSALGHRALASATGGQSNSALGAFALEANNGLSNSAVGAQALKANTFGGSNSSVGAYSLFNNTSGSNNAALGYAAMTASTTGARNIAVGSLALSANQTANDNTAVGHEALKVSTGSSNAAVGRGALIASGTGSSNSALGHNAGRHLVTGSDNVFIGHDAGFGLENGSNNVYIASPYPGGPLGTNNNKIHIGTQGSHNAVYLAGVRTWVAQSPMGVDPDGRLGVVAPSSARFKRSIRDMDSSSRALYSMRPVTYRYRDGVSSDSDLVQYGLIAEEVEAVAPELVVYDEDGKPLSVRYGALAPMLVNEIQQQQRTIAAQAEAIGRLAERLDRLESERGEAGGESYP